MTPKFWPWTDGQVSTLGSYRVYGCGVKDGGEWVHAHLPEDRTLVCFTDTLNTCCV